MEETMGFHALRQYERVGFGGGRACSSHRKSAFIVKKSFSPNSFPVKNRGKFFRASTPPTSKKSKNARGEKSESTTPYANLAGHLSRPTATLNNTNFASNVIKREICMRFTYRMRVRFVRVQRIGRVY